MMFFFLASTKPAIANEHDNLMISLKNYKSMKKVSKVQDAFPENIIENGKDV